MKYQEFIDEIERYESTYDLEEHTAPWSYLKTIEKLRDVQRNLRVLDSAHLREVVEPFLRCWGKMKSWVDYHDWDLVCEILRGLEDEFQILRGKKLITLNFDDKRVAFAIWRIYGTLYKARMLEATYVSKILHVLNPEVFVVWDWYIRQEYERKIIERLSLSMPPQTAPLIRTPDGYLEFLKEVKRELEEAFKDRQSETGDSWEEIERELRDRYDNKTIAKLIDEYNWIKRRKRYRSPPPKCLEY